MVRKKKKKNEGNMTRRGEKRLLDTKGGEPISVDRPINSTVARSIQYPVPDRDFCTRPILNRPRFGQLENRKTER
jgi:hypothetical protein